MQTQQDQIQAYHLFISGKVQGVYYRASTAKKAQAFGLKGWVKNLDDGRVEVHAQGPVSGLDSLLTWCEKGPILAKVSGIECKLAQVDENMAQFEVMR
ncbi:acylphosphatase [Oceaniserpentilla sp. 4NH20-0058]|uniref:acylphosphatase n=1 Tax=Oceaniserpentilla sp. 4NH20-0058 TaxID=3127660 RepID=UPI0031051B4E